METAQLARNLSEGRGYTTDSIRPLALYYLENAAMNRVSRSKILAQPVPDLSNAPIYPVLLAGLMKVFRFDFAAMQFSLLISRSYGLTFSIRFFFSRPPSSFFFPGAPPL